MKAWKILLLGLCKVMMVSEYSPVFHIQIHIQFGEFRPFLQKSLSWNQESFIKNLKIRIWISILIYFLGYCRLRYGQRHYSSLWRNCCWKVNWFNPGWGWFGRWRLRCGTTLHSKGCGWDQRHFGTNLWTNSRSLLERIFYSCSKQLCRES